MATQGFFSRFNQFEYGIGGSFKRGVGETLGFGYKRTGNMIQSQGFLGRKGIKGGLSSLGAKGILGKVAGSFLPWTLYSAYSGYKEGGIGGAAANVAMDAAVWGALRAAGTVLAPAATVAGAIAPIAIGGFAAYKYAESSIEYGKKLKKAEMGSEVVDLYGTLATTRQRSISALNNSHINARMALGNEALLMNQRLR